MPKQLYLFLCLFIFSIGLSAQGSEDIPVREVQVGENFTHRLNHKIEKYNHRITDKTIKTLTKLSRWEDKIRKILLRTSPDAEQRLFGNGQVTFGQLLRKVKEGQVIVNRYEAGYDGYRDSLMTSLRYLADNPIVKDTEEVRKSATRLRELTDKIGETDYLTEFIRTRKKMLVSESISGLGNSKLLKKIGKENYYYMESLKGYKELFSRKEETEELVRNSLIGIPAFQKFFRENSQLAAMFRMPGTGQGGNSSAVNIIGLQTRADVQNLIQQRISAAGPNAAAQVQQNLAEAQTKLSEIKDKLLQGGTPGTGGEVEMPDFRPDAQKSKTLWQRLEYGFDVQFAKNNYYIPSTTDIGLTLGYRLNDKSVAGVGLSYKMGLGSIDHIRFSSEGIGLRSFLDWKIKGQWYGSGGYEMNYLSAFRSIAELKDAVWQRSALMGISRQYKAGRKLKGEVKLLYDFMANSHVPAGSPFVFRVGYKM